VTNGLAFIVGTNGEDLGSPFIGSATYDGSQGYVFYTSFTVDFSYLPSVGGDYFFHLSSSGTDTSAFRDKIFANRANAATGKFRHREHSHFPAAVLPRPDAGRNLCRRHALQRRHGRQHALGQPQ
jgi:hypothetical protein